MRRKLLLLLLLFSLSYGEVAEESSKENKVLYTNLAAGAVIIGWGIVQWDYGQRSMHATDEGWFGRNTENGGADKLGHFFATYAATRAFSSLYQGYGYDENSAAAYGAFSSFFITTLLEIGDSFSDYGFSTQDFIMNGLGSLSGYLFEKAPKLDALMDIRIEYFPSSQVRSGESIDIFTDYDGMKFLAALKIETFDSFKNTPAKYLELQAGYYTRNNGKPDLERTAYIALGLNLSRLFNSDNRFVNTVFEYYQPPYTYIPYEYQYN